MYFVTKKCIEVSCKYDSMLYRCSYRSGGYMYKHFVKLRQCKKSKVVICFDRRKIVGWGIRFKPRCKYNIMLFVYKSHRKRGIGTKIYRQLANGLSKNNIRVYPNGESRVFFKKINKV